MHAIRQCLNRTLRNENSFVTTWAFLHSHKSSIQNSRRAGSSILNFKNRNFDVKLFDIGQRKTSNKPNIMENRLVWMDMEMTGLDVDTCHIMEIACLVTNSDLEIVSDNFHIIVHQPDEILASMNDWCVDHHGKSGLTEACRASKISLKEAEELILKFLIAHIPEKKCPLAGNSIWMDRIFLRKYLPRVDEYINYRIVDVSTIKELTKRWNPNLQDIAPRKQLNHRALDDIRESINELKFYKSKVFGV